MRVRTAVEAASLRATRVMTVPIAKAVAGRLVFTAKGVDGSSEVSMSELLHDI